LKLQTIAWGGLLLTGLVIAVAFVASPSVKPLPVLGSVGDFSLTDQDGRSVALSQLAGQMWVADLIFTRCAGQCLIMSGHFKKLQEALDSNLRVKLVSLTTDPEFDTAAVLKKYAERFGAQDSRWLFLTGPKPAIHRLAVDDLKLTMIGKKPDERDAPNDLFLHSEKLVLVDQRGRIRGYFDGETDDCIPRVVAAVKALSGER
jgi:protein SCO1